MIPIGFIVGYFILGIIAWSVILSTTGNTKGLHDLINSAIDLIFWPVALAFTVCLNLLNPDSDFRKAIRRAK